MPRSGALTAGDAAGSWRPWGTDCHASDIGHWLAMTGFFARGAVCGGTHGSHPTRHSFVGADDPVRPG